MKWPLSSCGSSSSTSKNSRPRCAADSRGWAPRSSCSPSAALATVATQDTWLDGYGIIAYGLVPLAFIPSGRRLDCRRREPIASSRASSRHRCERRAWLTAKDPGAVDVRGGLLSRARRPCCSSTRVTWACLRCFGRFLLWTPGLLVSSVAMGTLIGVLFIGRSIAAPAATGMGVLLAYAGLLPLQELLVAQANGATRTGHVVLASPAVLLKNGVRIHAGGGQRSRDHDVSRGSAWASWCIGAVRARRVGVPPRPGRRNVGDHERAALDDRASSSWRSACSRSCSPIRITTSPRRARTARRQFAASSLAREAAWRSSKPGGEAPAALLQHDSESRRPHGRWAQMKRRGATCSSCCPLRRSKP